MRATRVRDCRRSKHARRARTTRRDKPRSQSCHAGRAPRSASSSSPLEWHYIKSGLLRVAACVRPREALLLPAAAQGDLQHQEVALLQHLLGEALLERPALGHYVV